MVQKWSRVRDRALQQVAPNGQMQCRACGLAAKFTYPWTGIHFAFIAFAPLLLPCRHVQLLLAWILSFLLVSPRLPLCSVHFAPPFGLRVAQVKIQSGSNCCCHSRARPTNSLHAAGHCQCTGKCRPIGLLLSTALSYARIYLCGGRHHYLHSHSFTPSFSPLCCKGHFFV